MVLPSAGWSVVENVLHIVDAAGLLGADPAGGAQSAVGEILAGMGVMGQLDAFARAHIVHGMHAHYVAAAQGLDADLGVPAGFAHRSGWC